MAQPFSATFWWISSLVSLPTLGKELEGAKRSTATSLGGDEILRNSDENKMISGDIRVGWSIERCQGGCSASSSSFYTIPSHPHHHHLDKHHYHHHHHDEEEYHESMLSWTREASCRPIVLLAPAAGSCFNKNLHLWKFYLTKLWQHRNECQCSFPPRGAAYFDIRKKLGLAQPRGGLGWTFPKTWMWWNTHYIDRGWHSSFIEVKKFQWKQKVQNKMQNSWKVKNINLFIDWGVSPPHPHP